MSWERKRRKHLLLLSRPWLFSRRAALKQHLGQGESVGMVSPYLPCYIKIPNLTYKQWLDIDTYVIWRLATLTLSFTYTRAALKRLQLILTQEFICFCSLLVSHFVSLVFLAVVLLALVLVPTSSLRPDKVLSAVTFTMLYTAIGLSKGKKKTQ